jgi:periplasmic divalent cation tolerance protein
MTSARVVLVTTPEIDTAERIVQALVEERLAACGNIVPGVVSIYRWDEQVQRDDEVLLVLKTEQGQVEALRERVVMLHPYDVPEVVVLPVLGGHAPYLEWVARSTTR